MTVQRHAKIMNMSHVVLASTFRAVSIGQAQTAAQQTSRLAAGLRGVEEKTVPEV